MAGRFIDAIDSAGNVVGTFTETDGTVFNWDLPTIFPLLPAGNYGLVMRTEKTSLYSVAPDPNDFLLDAFPGATRAFSFRRLSSSYSGPVVRVRRSTGGESDFTTTEVTDGTLLSWVTQNSAAADGFVSAWYDQSGGGFDATTLTPSNEGQLVSAGTLLERAGKPAIDLTPFNRRMQFVNGLTNLMNMFVLGVAWKPNVNESTEQAWIVSASPDFQNGRRAYLNYGVDGFRIAGTSPFVPTVADQTQNMMAISVEAGNYEFWVNGSSVNTGTINDPGNLNPDNEGVIGNQKDSPFLGVPVQEIVVYDTAQTSNLAGIHANIATYYGIILNT